MTNINLHLDSDEPTIKAKFVETASHTPGFHTLDITLPDTDLTLFSSLDQFRRLREVIGEHLDRHECHPADAMASEECV